MAMKPTLQGSTWYILQYSIGVVIFAFVNLKMQPRATCSCFYISLHLNVFYESIMFTYFFQSIKAKMEELRPLIPVLESYKADTLLVKRFKEEAANVTEMLAMLQEQMGGLDYQELHSRVMSLEDRLRACMQKLGMSLKYICIEAKLGGQLNRL